MILNADDVRNMRRTNGDSTGGSVQKPCNRFMVILSYRRRG
jgi:hypothetical protein